MGKIIEHLILTVILAVSQAPSPVPGKTANHPAGSSQGIQKKSSTNEEPTTTPLGKNPGVSESNKNTGQNPTKADAQKTVVIRESVPVAIGTTGWERASVLLTGLYVIFTGLIVAVGIFGVCYARRTLIAIERQSRAAEDGAKAAKATAESSKAQSEAIITGDRAWILVETGEIPDGFEPDPWKVEALEIKPIVRNAGRTPGRIMRGFIAYLKLPSGTLLPPQPDYSGQMAQKEMQIILAANACAQPLYVRMSLTDFIPAREGKTRLHIYGFVDYLDFAGSERQTRFCFTYHVPSGFDSTPRGWYFDVGAPFDYTRCT